MIKTKDLALHLSQKIQKDIEIQKDIRKFYILAARNGFKEGNPIMEKIYQNIAEFKYME